MVPCAEHIPWPCCLCCLLKAPYRMRPDLMVDARPHAHARSAHLCHAQALVSGTSAAMTGELEKANQKIEAVEKDIQDVKTFKLGHPECDLELKPAKGAMPPRWVVYRAGCQRPLLHVYALRLAAASPTPYPAFMLQPPCVWLSTACQLDGFHLVGCSCLTFAMQPHTSPCGP